MKRLLPFLGLCLFSGLMIPMHVLAQRADFLGEPKTAPEFVRRIQLEVTFGSFEQAASYLKKLVELNAPEEDLLKIGDGEAFTTLLKLRNIDRWSADDKINDGAKKDLETVIQSISAAVQKQIKDTERIARFVKNLTETPEEAAFAEKELYRSGTATIPVLASFLVNNPTPDQRLAILTLLPRLDAATVPPLLSFLDVDDPALQTELLVSLSKRADLPVLTNRVDTDIIPVLWHLTVDQSKRRADVRAQALRMLEKLLQSDPARRSAEKELLAYAEKIYGKTATFGSKDGQEIWKWDPGKKELTSRPGSLSDIEEEYGLRYSRWALEANGKSLPAQALFTSIALEKHFLRNGSDKPLSQSSPELFATLASAPYELLADVLNRALRDKKPGVALGVVQVLGDRAEREAAQPTVSPSKEIKPSLLIQAMNFPDKRLQMAAIDALLRNPGPPASGTASQIVTILKDFLQEEKQADLGKPRVMIADFDRTRRDTLLNLVEAAGYNVEVVDTGKDLLRRLSTKANVDVLLLDHQIPGPMLGDVLPQLRANPRWASIPTIVVASADKPRQPSGYSLLLQAAAVLAAQKYEDLGKVDPDKDVDILPYSIKDLISIRRKQLQDFLLSNSVVSRNSFDVEVEFAVILSAYLQIRVEQIEDRYDTLKPKLKNTKQQLQLEERYDELKAVRRSFENIKPRVRQQFSLSSGQQSAVLLGINQIEDSLSNKQKEFYQNLWAAMTMFLPFDIVTETDRKLIRMVEKYPGVRVVPEMLNQAMVKEQLQVSLSDPQAMPRSDAEKKLHAKMALEWLKKMATGELPGYDIQVVDAELREALRNEELAPIALEAVGHLKSKEAQQDLANLVLSANKNPAWRLRAADLLIRHIQQRGKTLSDMQVLLIGEQVAKETDPDVKSKMISILGILQADKEQTGQRLQKYTPSVPAPAPKEAKKADAPEEKKDKE